MLRSEDAGGVDKSGSWYFTRVEQVDGVGMYGLEKFIMKSELIKYTWNAELGVIPLSLYASPRLTAHPDSCTEPYGEEGDRGIVDS
ncbi:hypothetical protein E2562_017302 [Oryza meyeriana var. granulata]|uniref:Uncharacterized protein n=1 Tax=Oryza meyeriana var. granulata TaxID=110450 RepID=A0A6G1C5L1_9ORYZ|nr:hypothetical protein E2562_012466 [Oryza meyeriana var. granulata]KAF0925745.1 hypothetical protein E2562_017302 [Oryza meyeriana var. granulata]